MAPVEFETAAAAEEKAKLQKHFSRFDIYFFLICTIVGVDTLGQVASNGAEGLTWLLVLAVLFFVPYAFLTAELGAAFTDEGGAYVWTRLACGRFVACINAVFYWFSNPVWIGGALVLLTIEAVNTYFFDISTGGFTWYVVGLIYIWFSVWSAILSFGIGKWIPTLGAWCRMILLGGFTISALDLRDLERAQPARRPATSRRPTASSSSSSRCSSSTTWASSSRTPRATRWRTRRRTCRSPCSARWSRRS